MELFRQEIIDIINNEVRLVVEDMKENLNKPSSSLNDSIQGSIEENNLGYDLDVDIDSYGQFLDRGVSGKGDPDFKGKSKTLHTSLSGFRFGSNSSLASGNTWKNKIDAWMNSKGINGGVDANNNKISRDSVNFLIRRSIYQHGIKGSLFATNALEELNNRVYERLSTIDLYEIIQTDKNIKI